MDYNKSRQKEERKVEYRSTIQEWKDTQANSR